MKKLFAYSAPLALALSGAVALPTAVQAAPGGNSTAAKACNSGLADLYGVSVGTCVNLFSHFGPIGLCKYLKDAELLDLLNFRNQGQCIKALS